MGHEKEKTFIIQKVNYLDIRRKSLSSKE